MNPCRYVTPLALAAAMLSGCATTRELTLDPPVAKASALQALAGMRSVDGDDDYITSPDKA